MAFTNRTIAITGAASGIGLATARLLAAQGARLSLADTKPTLRDSARSLPGDHLNMLVDVRNVSAVNSWMEATLKKFGRLDGAVNMAGILTPAIPLVDMIEENWEQSFAVNATGMFHCLRAEIRGMSRNESVRKGAIVSRVFLTDLV
jgi:NAD(P)-dependent dehydrogenase (short-subunit alcohol dehydrogenase family)